MTSVSVVIPSYNSGRFLERAVRSVLTQSFTDIEVIVVDDGSAQPQAEIESLDARIRFVRQRNRGVSVARNHGVEIAQAPLVAFLDHDDEWLPTKLQAQFDLISAYPDAAFWCSAFEWVDGDESLPSDDEQITYRGLLARQHVLLSSALVRVTDYRAIGGQNPLLTQMQDWDMFLKLAADAPPPAMASEALVRYNLHGSNASRDYRVAAAERFAILSAHARRAEGCADTATLLAIEDGVARTKELFAYQAIDAVGSSLSAGRRAEALRHFAYASRMSPKVAGTGIIRSIAARANRAFVGAGRKPAQ